MRTSRRTSQQWAPNLRAFNCGSGHMDSTTESHSDECGLMSDVCGGYTNPLLTDFFSGLEQDEYIDNSDSLGLSHAGENPTQDFYSPRFEVLGSAPEDIEFPRADTTLDYGLASHPMTAHYDLGYLSAYNYIHPHTLEPSGLEHGQNTPAAPPCQFPVVNTNVPTYYHESPSFESYHPAPDESSNTHPNNPPTAHVETMAQMNVPLAIRATEDAIKHYVQDLKQQLGKHVNTVICSLCFLEPNRRTHTQNAKPSNLERHLFSHFGVKIFGCFGCLEEFTTRDQAAKHAKGRHSSSRVRKLNSSGF
ncbi:unnamed protein product [Rhizoctonia solani]|uniref:C2H2-type domain-containing protein n=1 Tax=Rhizoctonia solani TaxID=456999 RepID=A0A8H3BHW2_9AGAM|nr:unnamed protein product [Rhizoctonia solani]